MPGFIDVLRAESRRVYSYTTHPTALSVWLGLGHRAGCHVDRLGLRRGQRRRAASILNNREHSALPSSVMERCAVPTMTLFCCAGLP